MKNEDKEYRRFLFLSYSMMAFFFAMILLTMKSHLH